MALYWFGTPDCPLVLGAPPENDLCPLKWRQQKCSGLGKGLQLRLLAPMPVFVPVLRGGFARQ